MSNHFYVPHQPLKAFSKPCGIAILVVAALSLICIITGLLPRR